MPWYCFYVKEECPLDYLENYSGILTFPTRSSLLSSQLLLSCPSADFVPEVILVTEDKFQNYVHY